MAQLQGTFFSTNLSRATHFQAVLCNDNSYPHDDNPHYKRPVKNVYLLHGYCGTDSDWILNAPIQEIANNYNLNIFCPQGDNSFYLNGASSDRQYQSFTGVEFIEYTRKTFNLSDRKEDTIIGGLSMGGFGAIHTGLAYPETFSKIIALSSALIVNGIKDMTPETENPVANYAYYRETFGELSTVKETINDPEFLINDLLAKKAAIPDIFMAVGTEDFLLEPNKEFYEFLKSKNVPVDFHTGPGVHDFNFWREWLVKGLEWALK